MYIYIVLYIYTYIYVWSVLLFNNVSHELASGTHQTGVRFGPAAQSPCVGGLVDPFSDCAMVFRSCKIPSSTRCVGSKSSNLAWTLQRLKPGLGKEVLFPIYIIPWHSTTELLYFWPWFNALRPPAAHCHVPSLKGPGVVVELVRKFPTESRIVISLISVVVISMTCHWHKWYFHE